MSLKLRFVLALSAISFVGSSYAAGDAGCGLGSLIFSSNKKIPQILAIITNGVLGSQTFGITTGTSGCKASGWVKVLQKQHDYMVANFNSLQKEGAEGTGEILDGLASAFGCAAENYDNFGVVVQDSYSKVFSSQSPDAALEFLRTELQASPHHLTDKCSAIVI